MKTMMKILCQDRFPVFRRLLISRADGSPLESDECLSSFPQMPSVM